MVKSRITGLIPYLMLLLSMLVIEFSIKRAGMVSVDQLQVALWVERLREGDAGAFEALYGALAKDLLRAVLYQLKDMEVARDVVQEVFLRVWNQRERLDASRPFKPYVNGIARKLIIDSYRKVASDRKLTEWLVRSASEAYSHSDEVFDYKETVELVNTAIARLSPQQQVVYRKCRLEGRSHEEVASELGISKATVNNHIVKANRSVIAYLHKMDKGVLRVLLLMSFL